MKRQLESRDMTGLSLFADILEFWWPRIIEASSSIEERDTSSKADAFLGGQADLIEVRMEPGMLKGKILIIVTIEGLQYRG